MALGRIDEAVTIAFAILSSPALARLPSSGSPLSRHALLLLHRCEDHRHRRALVVACPGQQARKSFAETVCNLGIGHCHRLQDRDWRDIALHSRGRGHAIRARSDAPVAQIAQTRPVRGKGRPLPARRAGLRGRPRLGPAPAARPFAQDEGRHAGTLARPVSPRLLPARLLVSLGRQAKYVAQQTRLQEDAPTPAEHRHQGPGRQRLQLGDERLAGKGVAPQHKQQQLGALSPRPRCRPSSRRARPSALLSLHQPPAHCPLGARLGAPSDCGATLPLQRQHFLEAVAQEGGREGRDEEALAKERVLQEPQVRRRRRSRRGRGGGRGSRGGGRCRGPQSRRMHKRAPQRRHQRMQTHGRQTHPLARAARKAPHRAVAHGQQRHPSQVLVGLAPNKLALLLHALLREVREAVGQQRQKELLETAAQAEALRLLVFAEAVAETRGREGREADVGCSEVESYVGGGERGWVREK